MRNNYSIIIPAYNETVGIARVLDEILAIESLSCFEIIVVDDCSTDTTSTVVGKYPVRLISNVQNFGYGYSLKRGIAEAKHKNIIILDADGSYPVSDIPLLIQEYEKGFDMVVGARQGIHYRGSTTKYVARFFFRILSEFTTGRKIPDINSGFRVFRKDLSFRFFHTLSSGFSFTTTITLAFMLNAHSVSYIPIEYHKREGRSKVRYWRDTLRSTQIITEAIIFYNPLKLFLLCAFGVMFAGVLSVGILLFDPWVALLFFLTAAVSIAVFALGFIAVLIRHVSQDIKR